MKHPDRLTWWAIVPHNVGSLDALAEVPNLAAVVVIMLSDALMRAIGGATGVRPRRKAAGDGA